MALLRVQGVCDGMPGGPPARLRLRPVYCRKARSRRAISGGRRTRLVAAVDLERRRVTACTLTCAFTRAAHEKTDHDTRPEVWRRGERELSLALRAVRTATVSGERVRVVVVVVGSLTRARVFCARVFFVLFPKFYATRRRHTTTVGFPSAAR